MQGIVNYSKTLAWQISKSRQTSWDSQHPLSAGPQSMVLLLGENASLLFEWSCCFYIFLTFSLALTQHFWHELQLEGDHLFSCYCWWRSCFIMSEQEAVSSPDEDIQETQPSGSSSGCSDQDSSKRIDDEKMTEVNGEIGYYIRKGTEFIPMTNFSVSCIGYATENSRNNCSEGFLFNVVQKTTILQEDDDDQQQKR